MSPIGAAYPYEPSRQTSTEASWQTRHPQGRLHLDVHPKEAFIPTFIHDRPYRPPQDGLSGRHVSGDGWITDESTSTHEVPNESHPMQVAGSAGDVVKSN